MGIKRRLRTELNALIRRAPRPVIARRPGGIAVFLPHANDRHLRSGDILLNKGAVVEIETDAEKHKYSEFGHHSRARLDGKETVVIGGARAHDGLYFGDYLAFHQGCGTEYFSTELQSSITTAAVQHLYIDGKQIF